MRGGCCHLQIVVRVVRSVVDMSCMHSATATDSCGTYYILYYIWYMCVLINLCAAAIAVAVAAVAAID